MDTFYIDARMITTADDTAIEQINVTLFVCEPSRSCTHHLWSR